MKTTILMAALLSGVAMTAAAAQGAEHRERPDFATLDLNGDGGVTLDEMQGQAAARFTETDTDGDGALSLAEMTAAAQARAGDRAAQMLERMDANGDGLLQQSEMQPRGGDMMERMFARMDRNDDGTISEVEFEVAKALMEERQKDRRHGEGRGHDGDGRGPRDRG